MGPDNGPMSAIHRGKYAALDPRYEIELNVVINPYSNRFLADHRTNKTTVLSDEDRRWISQSEGPVKLDTSAAGDLSGTPATHPTRICSLTTGRGEAFLFVQRLGQTEFREQLMAAYACRCAITGCDVPEALQAAHILPYLGPQSNVVQNGLLLRADVHNLFDSYLLSVEPDTLVVYLAPVLRHSVYAKFHGTVIRCPDDEKARPGRALLRRHFASFSVGVSCGSSVSDCGEMSLPNP